MGKAQRDKGKRGELELAHELTTLCQDNALDLVCQRSQQFSGKSGDADVRGLPGIYIECKRVEHLNIHEAYSRAKDDCNAKRSKDIPVVMFRRDRESWKATLSLEDFMRIYSAAYKKEEEPLGKESIGSE